jgi:hypothetical protein
VSSAVCERQTRERRRHAGFGCLSEEIGPTGRRCPRFRSVSGKPGGGSSPLIRIGSGWKLGVLAQAGTFACRPTGGPWQRFGNTGMAPVVSARIVVMTAGDRQQPANCAVSSSIPAQSARERNAGERARLLFAQSSEPIGTDNGYCPPRRGSAAAPAIGENVGLGSVAHVDLAIALDDLSAA